MGFLSCAISFEKVADQCFKHLCQNNATCIENHVNYTCACDSSGWSGTYCEKGRIWWRIAKSWHYLYIVMNLSPSQHNSVGGIRFDSYLGLNLVEACFLLEFFLAIVKIADHLWGSFLFSSFICRSIEIFLYIIRALVQRCLFKKSSLALEKLWKMQILKY